MVINTFLTFHIFLVFDKLQQSCFFQMFFIAYIFGKLHGNQWGSICTQFSKTTGKRDKCAFSSNHSSRNCQTKKYIITSHIISGHAVVSTFCILKHKCNVKSKHSMADCGSLLVSPQTSSKQCYERAQFILKCVFQCSKQLKDLIQTYQTISLCVCVCL